MSKRIISIITVLSMTALCFAACGGEKPAETSAEETSATAAAIVETQAAEVTETTEVQAAETTQAESGAIPQPGDIYNGHTVDHTEDQPDCDDASHGTVWIFYTDCEDIDYITY